MYLYGLDILSSVEKNALVLSRGDINTNTLDNLQQFYKLRPDVVVLDQQKLTYAW